MTDNVEVLTEVIEVPVVVPTEVPAPEVVVPELIYRYQPVDDEGRKLGGEQVIKYHTSDELAKKLTDQNIELIRTLRKETKKNRLGVLDVETLPESATRLEMPEYKPRVLTEEERYQLSKDLNDPEKFEDANQVLFEANTGMKPEQFRDNIKKLNNNNMKLLAKAASDEFLLNNPTYFKCQENYENICNWILKNNLDPTMSSNFQLAYDSLKGFGLILEAPNAREEAPVTESKLENTHPAQTETSRIASEESAAIKRPSSVPTGLTRSQTSDSGTPPKTAGYTKEEIDKMPSDVYKRKIQREPGFAEFVNAMAEKNQPRQ